MFIQYRGFDILVSSRIYSFQVIDPPRKTREFTVKVRSEEFCPGHLGFQDGPGLCSARLQRELKGETEDLLAEAELHIEEQDVQAYRFEHYPRKKPPAAPGSAPTISHNSPPPDKHFQNRGYWPLGPTQLPKSEEISTLLLHEPGDALDGLRLALESQSVKVCCLRTCLEALPLVTGPNPPHLIFTQPKLPDGIWVDVVTLAMRAPQTVNVIVVGRLANVELYLQTITAGAFDFIVPPLTGYELTHVVRCAIENVLSRREAQARPV